MGARYLVVGCGFSGAVLSNQLAMNLDCEVEIWEERNHIGGNCYTKRDTETGIMVHEYGPHIFNTDRKDIWDYVNGFARLCPYVHRIKARSGDAIYSLPVNLHTINQFFNKAFSPAEAKQFLQELSDHSIVNPKNFEEQALSFIGKELYEAFFYGYTKKQWGCEPKELPASILKRIPVRFSYDDNYHPSQSYTGIPPDGYTDLIEKIATHPAIKITLEKKFNPTDDLSDFDHVFYTGPLDAYFNYSLGRLGYRTVSFEKSVMEGDFQGVAQVNYCDVEVPFTRITEHKHFTPWETHEQTVYFKEYSRETGVDDQPFYPKRLEKDKQLLRRYRLEAETLQKISFLGRLATYRYMDMHHVIGEALDFANLFIQAKRNNSVAPVFSNVETV
ncbi:MAG: UDP-galactopyranose mutase [Bacteroidota bacterium]